MKDICRQVILNGEKNAADLYVSMTPRWKGDFDFILRFGGLSGFSKIRLDRCVPRIFKKMAVMIVLTNAGTKENALLSFGTPPFFADHDGELKWRNFLPL